MPPFIKPNRSRDAFTLVELLVVIGIIALLISILLPSLASARRAANTVKCMANLRSIMQAQQIYAAQNNGWMAGSANTTGLHFMTQGSFAIVPPTGPGLPFNDTNAPFISSTNDWQSPLARIMGIKFEEGGTVAQRKARILKLMEHTVFTCPENTPDILMAKFGGSPADFGALPLQSYNMAQIFTLISFSTPPPNVSSGSHSNRTGGNVSGPQFRYDPPLGYAPKISKIKNSPSKIAFADGTRSTRGEPPTYDPAISGGGGNMFADQGSWSLATRAWFRGHAPGNGSTGTDARLFPYRHGQRRQQGATADTFRMNIAFWDGHVETMGDLASSDPTMWMPVGTRITAQRGGTDGIPIDTYDRFLKPATGTYTIPK
jgi:prepilin-type N-terminal cleavage/methylation domain-containing protein/prepilin-type processing-associated H-X9-DG protein